MSDQVNLFDKSILELRELIGDLNVAKFDLKIKNNQISKYEKKIELLESIVDKQNDKIANLENALKDSAEIRDAYTKVISSKSKLWGSRKLDKENEFAKLISSSKYFDEDFYKNKYFSTERKDFNYAKDYLVRGGFEGNDPSAAFDSEWYLSEYKDVKEAGLNPLVHYLLYGIYENRFPKRYNLE